MSYREYMPHPLLASLVECYWSFQNHVIQQRTIFPDSCSDIIFNFGDPMVISADGVRSRSKGSAFVVGTMTYAILSTGSGKQDLFGIRFRAGGLSAVIRNPQHELTDSSLRIDDCGHHMPSDLPEKMHTASQAERASMIDGWLLAGVTALPEKTSWWWAVNRILSTHGNIRVKDLAVESAMSEKQLERRFLQYVGVTPKTLSTIARFREAKRQLEKNHTSLEDLAWDLGYNDHAHFTKSFKMFAGFPPSEYTEKNR